MLEYINSLSGTEIFFLIVGFVGQALFASRFIIQWIYSEKKGESSEVATSFHNLSICTYTYICEVLTSPCLALT